MVYYSPTLYYLHEKEDEGWTRRYDNHSHADIDLAIATEHICLAATELGLGSCWVCNFDTHKMTELGFNKDGYIAVAIIPIGHIASDCPCNEKIRKPFADVIEVI